jgi:uncharacterized membrane protein
MDTSIFLAKLMGPIFVIIGVGLFLNRERYLAVVDEVILSKTLLYVFGIMALTGGLAVLLTHNVWVWDWPVVITIIAWLMVVRGSLRIVIPQQIEAIAKGMTDQLPTLLLISDMIVISVGLFLSWKGYS